MFDIAIFVVLDTFDIKLEVMNRTLELEIFDTAGQEDFSTIRQASLEGVDAVVVCFSCDSEDSLQNIRSLWVPEIKTVKSAPWFLFVGTKSDLINKNDPYNASWKNARNLGKALGAYKVMKCSAKQHGESRGKKGNVSKVFKDAIKAGLLRKELIEVKKRRCTIL